MPSLWEVGTAGLLITAQSAFRGVVDLSRLTARPEFDVQGEQETPIMFYKLITPKLNE